MIENNRFDDDERPDNLFNNPLDDDFIPQDDNADNIEKEVKVVGVFEHRSQELDQQSEFVVLVRDSENRTVLIVIGKFEAMAISLALEGHSADRPLTHDLLNNCISKLGGDIQRIVIDDLWNNTYYAKVTINHADKSIQLDSRPSDAIALALRAKAPIFMTESVMQKAGMREE